VAATQVKGSGGISGNASAEPCAVSTQSGKHDTQDATVLQQGPCDATCAGRSEPAPEQDRGGVKQTAAPGLVSRALGDPRATKADQAAGAAAILFRGATFLLGRLASVTARADAAFSSGEMPIFAHPVAALFWARACLVLGP
jgi:hypothetical protein